jgi:RNA polymerase sigma factor (TIGR02999 family)
MFICFLPYLSFFHVRMMTSLSHSGSFANLFLTCLSEKLAGEMQAAENKLSRQSRRPHGGHYTSVIPSRQTTALSSGCLEDLMGISSPSEITQLLQTWGDGNQESLAKLMPLVYQALHQAAHRCMLRERPGHTLQTTALINEVYLRLVDVKETSWQNRAHFFAVSAQLMRRVLTDFARSRSCAKRGGGALHVSLDEALIVSLESWPELAAIDEALQDLSAFDARKAQVVELRFFGGLSVEETAEVLKVSRETVIRDWKLAKVWLVRELYG